MNKIKKVKRRVEIFNRYENKVDIRFLLVAIFFVLGLGLILFNQVSFTGFIVGEIGDNVTTNLTKEVILENISLEGDLENVSEEVNITNITIEENITVSNITENITEEFNVSEEVNITENITIEENITELANITLPENITGPIIEENVTEPLENITNITLPEENVTIENLTIENVTELVNITDNITIAENITEEVVELIQGKAEINKPVKWIKRIKGKLSTELPEKATNIKVISLKDKKDTTFRTKEELEKKVLELEKIEDIEIEYYTEAPGIIEEQLEDKKIVTVYSDTHYKNVRTYADISETEFIISVYWVEGKSVIESVSLDTDDNGLIDRVEWTTPYLSKQTFALNETYLVRRTPTTNIYLRPAGKYVAEVYSGIVNYKVNNTYAPINISIDNVNCEINYDYCVDKNLYQVHYKTQPATADSVKYIKDSYSFSFQPLSLNYRNDLNQIQQISMVQSVDGTASVNEFTYEDLFVNGTHISYEYLTTILKEKLILDNFSVLPSLEQYIVDGGNPTLDLDFLIQFSSDVDIYIDGELWDKKTKKITSSRVEFRNSTDLLFYLPKPYVYDNNYSSKDLIYEFKKAGSSLYTIVKTNYSWLQNAVYPVKIDPTIDLTDDDIIRDGYIDYTGTYTFYENETTMRVGADAPPGTTGYNSYIDFNTSSIPDDATINQVNLSLEIVSTPPILNYNYSITQMHNDTKTWDSPQFIYEDADNGTNYSTNGWYSAGSKTVKLIGAETDLQDKLVNDYFSVGINFSDANFGGGLANFLTITTSEGDTKPILTVVYTISELVAPNLTYESPTPANNSIVSSIIINVSCVDNDNSVENVTFNWDGANSSWDADDGTYWWVDKSGVSEGNYSFYAWCNDTVGNYNVTNIRRLTLDNTRPTVNLEYLSNGSVALGKNATLRCYVTDNFRIFNISLYHNLSNLTDYNQIFDYGTNITHMLAINGSDTNNPISSFSMGNESEFINTDYPKITDSDNTDALQDGAGMNDYQGHKFILKLRDVKTNETNNLTVWWEGYSTVGAIGPDQTYGANLSIWNFSSNSWDYIDGSDNDIIGDQNITKTFTRNLDNLINSTNDLVLLALASRKEAPLGPNSLYTDYVQVKVNHNTTNWGLNQTISGINDTVYNATFTINGTVDKSLIWNCYACDNVSNCSWASSNWTVNVSISTNIIPDINQTLLQDPTIVYSNSTVNISANIYDDDNEAMNVTVTWYNGTTLYLNYTLNQSYVNGSTISAGSNISKVWHSGEWWNLTFHVKDDEPSTNISSIEFNISYYTPNADALSQDPITVYSNSTVNISSTIKDLIEDSNTHNITVLWTNGSNMYINYTLKEDYANNSQFSAGSNISAVWYKGETWNVSFNITNAGGENYTTSAQFTITNYPPNASSVNATSDEVNNQTGGNLTGSYGFNYTIDEHDTMQSNSTRWYKDDALQTNLFNKTNVSQSFTLAGETWIFSVKVYDGTDWSDWVNSSGIVIETPPNNIPENSSISLLPDPAYTNSTLKANITIYDDDLDSLNVTIEWFNLTTEYSEVNYTSQSNSTNVNFTLTPEIQHKGENWNVSFTITDIKGATIRASKNITISNLAPNWSTVPDQSWDKDGSVIINLTKYSSDLDEEDLNYSYSSVSNIVVSVNNNTGVATLTSDTGFTGTRYIFFYAFDLESNTSSNNITLTISEVTDGGGGGGGEACSDQCSSGSRECSGNGYRTCGNYDDDSCSEWGSVTGCGENEVCEDGYCVSIEEECVPDWGCTGWSICVNGAQTRECTDLNNCGVVEGKPIEEKSCFVEITPEEARTEQKECLNVSGLSIEEIKFLEGIPGNILCNYTLPENQTIIPTIRCGGIELSVGAAVKMMIWADKPENYRTKLRLMLDFTNESKPCPWCYNKIKDYDETGIDCGGSCPSCEEKPIVLCGNNICEDLEGYTCPKDCKEFNYWIIVALLLAVSLSILIYYKSERREKFYYSLASPVLTLSALGIYVFKIAVTPYGFYTYLWVPIVSFVLLIFYVILCLEYKVVKVKISLEFIYSLLRKVKVKKVPKIKLVKPRRIVRPSVTTKLISEIKHIAKLIWKKRIKKIKPIKVKPLREVLVKEHIDYVDLKAYQRLKHEFDQLLIEIWKLIKLNKLSKAIVLCKELVDVYDKLLGYITYEERYVLYNKIVEVADELELLYLKEISKEKLKPFIRVKKPEIKKIKRLIRPKEIEELIKLRKYYRVGFYPEIEKVKELNEINALRRRAYKKIKEFKIEEVKEKRKYSKPKIKWLPTEKSKIIDDEIGGLKKKAYKDISEYERKKVKEKRKYLSKIKWLPTEKRKILDDEINGLKKKASRKIKEFKKNEK